MSFRFHLSKNIGGGGHRHIDEFHGVPISLQSYVTSLYRASGLTNGYSSHSGRRTFASRLIAHGHSLDTVQLLLGHYAISDPDNPNYYVDAGRVRSQGWEAEVNGEPLPGWNVYAGYTLLNTDYLSGGSSTGESYDAEEPHSLFKLWTTYRFQQGLLRGWMIGGGMLAQTATSRATAQYEQGGYAVYNAQFGYSFNKHTSATMTVNNLFDRRYYARTVGTYFSQFGDRRNVMLSVRTDF